MTTLFQIVPNATSVLADKTLKAAVSQTGAVYNKSLKTITTGKGGIWVKDTNLPLTGGLQIEMVFMLLQQRESDGALVCKNNTLAIGISSGKFKTGWLVGENDQYNASTDQIFGMRSLEVGKKYTLRWSYDTDTGMVVMQVNGIPERKRYRVQGPGQLKRDTSAWQLFKDTPANIYSITVSTGKPNLVAPGMECFAVLSRLEFAHIDPSMVGSTISVTMEHPFGSVTDSYDLPVKSTEPILCPLPVVGLAGIHTAHIAATKAGKTVFQAKRNVLGPQDRYIGPSGIVKGIYHVNRADFATVSGLGATHVFCDYTINNNSGGWVSYTKYLEAAWTKNLKMLVAGSFHAKVGTLAFDGYRSLAGWYAADEAAGDFERLRINYLGCKRLYPEQPVVINLNNFARIREAAECADIIMLNIYLTGTQDRRKITDMVKLASRYCPTWLVLPIYSSIQTSTADLIEMARMGIEAGATGIWLFEYDHRSLANPNDWYIGGQPELMQRIKDVFNSF